MYPHLLMNLELTDRTAIIAASSSGLGYASARRLLEEGANVAICSRSSDRVESAAEQLADETNVNSNRILPAVCDITERDDIEDFVETTVETFGSLDIQVNNHGGPPAVTFDEATEEQWEESHEGVISSNRWMAQAALPYLKKSNIGSLLVVTSASARESPKNHAISNVYRLGLYGLVKTISREYGPEVRANAITPRFVMTDRIEYKIKRRADHREISEEEALQSRVEEVSLDRPGDPEEFADAVAYLASPRASYVTGEILSVDGGWSRFVL
ncbi:SDR family oxidoreductase [Natronococcus roseus]|uniref:SDR family oxidoreductase n=1 Tax=Natronococcus roseus TaxID=1052014 RepID=UPI00374CFE24